MLVLTVMNVKVKIGVFGRWKWKSTEQRDREPKNDGEGKIVTLQVDSPSRIHAEVVVVMKKLCVKEAVMKLQGRTRVAT